MAETSGKNQARKVQTVPDWKSEFPLIFIFAFSHNNMKKPLLSSADQNIKDLQVDTAITDNTTSIHGDSISSAERIDHGSGHGLYRSDSYFIFLLQIWEEYWWMGRYTVRSIFPSSLHALHQPCVLIYITVVEVNTYF